MLLPSFIPMAEETALVGPMGEWGAEEACRQMSAWPPAHPPPTGIACEPLGARAGAARPCRHRSSDDPRALAAGERLAARDHRERRDDDAQPRDQAAVGAEEMGVRLAIDDFGTGFSSLDWLRRLPRGVAQDRPVLRRDLEATAGRSRAPDAIIAMAHSLGLPSSPRASRRPPAPRSSSGSAATWPRDTSTDQPPTSSRYWPACSAAAAPPGPPPPSRPKRRPPRRPRAPGGCVWGTRARACPEPARTC